MSLFFVIGIAFMMLIVTASTADAQGWRVTQSLPVHKVPVANPPPGPPPPQFGRKRGQAYGE